MAPAHHRVTYVVFDLLRLVGDCAPSHQHPFA